MLRFLLNEISNSISDYQEFEKRESAEKVRRRLSASKMRIIPSMCQTSEKDCRRRNQ